MRQFLSLESYSGNTAFGNLSMEEEQDLIVEAAQDQAGVDADMAQVDRISDMSDALEDLAVVADGIEGDDGTGEASATEGQLIDTMANMAVAGTDVQPDEIIPAMESMGKRRYSAESIRERAKAIWESIRKFLKGVWDKITAFFYKIFGTIPGLRKRLVALKKQVADNSRRTVDAKKITISTGVAPLSTNYKTPANADELKKNFSALLTTAKGIYGDTVDDGIKLGEAVLKGLDDFDPESPSKSLGKFIIDMRNVKPSAPGNGYKAVTGTRFSADLNARISEPLMGNISIVVKAPTPDIKDGESRMVHCLELLSKIGTEVVQTNEKPKDSPTSFEMDTASNSSMENLLDEALDLLDVLEKYQRGKRATEMKSLRSKLETASDKCSAAMDKVAGSDEKSERAAVPYFRAMLNFNSAYTRWMKDPAMPMISHSLASIRGIVKVCEKSLSAYK